MTTIVEIGMSLEEFSRLYDEEPFELIDGERIPVSPQMPRSSRLGGRLFRNLADHVDENKLGEVFQESPFVLKPSKKWVKGSRVPDVMFISAERLKALAEADPDWEISPLPIVPDLAVEVMSPTDRFSTAKKKVERYIQDGVKLAWIIDAERRVIFVRTPDNEQFITLTEEDKLTGGDVIPGFELKIIKLFE